MIFRAEDYLYSSAADYAGEQGVLKDGQNYKNNDQVIRVGGDGQPTFKGVDDFSLNYLNILVQK